MELKLSIILLFICLVGFSQVEITGNEDLITLAKDFKFQHPMTVTSAKEIAIVKDRIKNGVEPQATAFKKLILAADSLQTFLPNPPDTFYISKGDPELRDSLWRSCSAAYTSALAYTYTGNEKYAIKAVEVLNTWARKNTAFTGKSIYLQLGAWFTPMLYSADLLNDYEGWKQEDRFLFKRWWKEQCLVNTIDVMRTKLNNWADAGVVGCMTAAVVFEDQELLEESLNELLSYYKANSTGKVASFGTSWKLANDSNGVYLPLEAVRELGRKGLTYSYLAMTTTVQSLEMARYAGYDFWTAKTPQGANFQGVIEQLFKWSILGEPFPWYKNPDNDKTVQVNTFEIANSNCILPTSMKDWLNTNRPVLGEQGDEYVTLNKGDIFNF